MSTETDKLDELVNARYAAWDNFLATGIPNPELFDDIDAAISAYIDIINVKLDRLYGAYLEAHSKACVAGTRLHDDALWNACETARLAWIDLRNACGLQEGERWMSEYFAYRKVKQERRV